MAFDPYKILITGTGLIGGFLAERLIAQGHSVTVVSRSGIARLGEITSGTVQVVCHDLSRPIPDLGRFDVILHSAALSPAKAMPSPQEFVESNVMGTFSVAQYAQRTRPALVIYCSAISVYGPVHESVVTEDTPIRCSDWYGMTKYSGEVILQQYSDSFNTVALRLPAVLGPGSYRPWLGWVLRRGLSGLEIPIYNPQAAFNNVTNLHEVFRFVAQLMERPPKSFDVVQMAATESITIIEAVQRVLGPVQNGSRIVEVDSDRESFSLSIEKLWNSYHFKPDTTSAIIDRYVQEMLESQAVQDGR
ncbi:MAG: NAD(P)-dependent oxidoreductase [Phycisphaerae bacterium]|nr:NAD(P)-dependent oxidoreductase [Phycisphaerae bacterium]